MSVDKWSNAFIDASTPGSLIFPMSIGKQICSFGIDLAITHPAELFMEHEWIKRTHLHPQLHAHAWLGAIKAFGPLFYHHDNLCEAVINAMHVAEESETGGQDHTHMDAEVAEESQMVDVTLTSDSFSKAKNRRSKSSAFVDDDASADTTQAGEANLHQHKLTGKDRTNQIRYDIKFHVVPSKEADKTMIAAAKKCFAKAKEMDESIVIYPWFKSSKSSKIQETHLIPETMGAFKTFFHQAQPRVAGGFVYMRVWLGHNKDTEETLKDDLQWWMNNQQFGL
jgi:hypothetical protein